MENALVHRVGDVDRLTEHITLLDANRVLLEKLRAASLDTVDEITWKAAGRKLLSAYKETIAAYQQSAEAIQNHATMAIVNS
jgi:phage tail protein X